MLMFECLNLFSGGNIYYRIMGCCSWIIQHKVSEAPNRSFGPVGWAHVLLIVTLHLFWAMLGHLAKILLAVLQCFWNAILLSALRNVF